MAPHHRRSTQPWGVLERIAIRAHEPMQPLLENGKQTMAHTLAAIAENITQHDVKTTKDARSLNVRRIAAESRDIADEAADYIESHGIIARFDLSHYLN